MDDFVRCATLLASPTTEPAVRGQADAWLAAFRRDPAAWGVALGVLRTLGTPPEVRLQAASLLAWKVKRQLAQLQPLERQAELAEVLTALAATDAPALPGGGQQQDVAVRGVCVALANLAIQCNGWARPLDTLGPRLSRERMLEFLTLLPQECEDAAAAAQAASAEQAWGLKARVHEWSPEVTAWLHSLHSTSCDGSGGGSGSPGPSPASPQQLPMAARDGGQHHHHHQQQQQQQRLTLAVLRCFGAWVRWGCLPYVDPRHAAYFASLAGQLLFAADPARGLPYHPDCLPTAVDVASDVIEHASEALQPLLHQLAAALPARAVALHDAGAQGEAEELCHVFALFCSTNCTVCAGEGPEGEALRQGLLQLLVLPMEPGSETGAAVPALGAVSDLLEHLVSIERGERGEDGGEEGGAPRAMRPEARRTFAAALLDVLLVQLQPYECAFEPPPSHTGATSAAGPGVAGTRGVAAAGLAVEGLEGTHSPEGVPDTLRREAGQAVIDTCGELLGAEGLMEKLVGHVDAAICVHGVRSVGAQRALSAALFSLDSCYSYLESCCPDRLKEGRPPGWFQGLVRLYSMVAEVHGSRQADVAPVTILDTDFLDSFAHLGHLLVPMIQASKQQQQQQQQPDGMLELVLRQALRALCSPHKTPDVAVGSTGDVVERAANALRVLCSSLTTAGLPTSPQLLAGLELGLSTLQHPARIHQQYQTAQSQLVAALVHALHGISPGNYQLRAQAEGAVQQHIFAPLAAALAEVQAVAQGGGTRAASPVPPPPRAQLRPALWRLHAALHQLQALLNALESYTWYDDAQGSGGGSGGGGGGLSAHLVGRSVAQAAVAAFLASWPQLAEVCTWRQLEGTGSTADASTPASGAFASTISGSSGTSLASLRREVYQEVAHCLSSCMALDEAAFQQALPSFANTVATCLFMPGAAVLHGPLIAALERYAGRPQYQQPLLSTAAALLAAPQAQRLAGLRGGDADPEVAEALLSMLGCCLRLARQWSQAAQLGAVEPLLGLGLPLASANAGCHHRDVSQRAVGVLTALLALAQAADSPLRAGVQGFVLQRGRVVVQGMLLALMSLNSAAHLPKVVSLVSDVALVATSLAVTQQAQQQPQQAQQGLEADAVCAAAAGLLGSWLAAAHSSLAESGILPHDQVGALQSAAQWAWQPALQLAALQLAQQQGLRGGEGGTNGGPGLQAAELRRAMQRSVRQLADLMRRSNGRANSSDKGSA